MIDINKMQSVKKDSSTQFQKGQDGWNKGKTSKDDKRILKGKEHPMYGKPASELAKQKTSEYNKLNPRVRNEKGKFVKETAYSKTSTEEKE